MAEAVAPENEPAEGEEGAGEESDDPDADPAKDTEATEATEAQVVSLNGMVRPLQVPAGLSQWTDLPAGIYVIRLQGKSFKVSLQ